MQLTELRWVFGNSETTCWIADYRMLNRLRHADSAFFGGVAYIARLL
jgi:hypothetical protein